MGSLIADHLVLAHPRTLVVGGVSLCAAEGTLLGLIGPNGAGKTTVLRALAGLHRPASGRVLADGRDVYRLSPLSRAQAIALVPQGETHAWPLTVEEIVALGRAAHRGWLLPLSTGDRRAIERALRRVGLVELRHQRVDRLSGGERQRVLIARALAQEAQVLLLDEPTANLDVQHQLQLLDLVRDLAVAGRQAAVVAMHDLGLVARYCDQLVLLHRRRILAAGPPETVLTPGHLRAAFQVDAELFRDPRGRWALSLQNISEESQ